MQAITSKFERFEIQGRTSKDHGWRTKLKEEELKTLEARVASSDENLRESPREPARVYWVNQINQGSYRRVAMYYLSLLPVQI